MSVVLVTKHGTTGTPSNLSNGELAVDISKGRLWVGNLSAPNGRVQVSSGASIQNGTDDGGLLRWNNTAAEWETASEVSLTSTGDLGLGTLNPIRSLHIKAVAPGIRIEDFASGSVHDIVGESAGSLSLRVDQNQEADDSYFRIQIDSTERLRITDTGNVGIGDTSPTEKLSVDGNVAADRFVSVADSQSAPAHSWSSDPDTGMFRRGTNALGFTVGGSEIMYMSDSGIARIVTDGNDDRIAGTSSGSGASTINRFVTLSQANYDAIVTPDANTLYIIV